ncbi:Cu-binding protein [Savitreella phatthalungensis]
MSLLAKGRSPCLSRLNLRSAQSAVQTRSLSCGRWSRASVVAPPQGPLDFLGVGGQQNNRTMNPAGYSQTKLAEATMKRFWKRVAVERRDLGYTVTLDGKALKTPGAAVLVVPEEKERLAQLIAAEWAQVSSAQMRQHQLPLTSLAARAIDHLELHHRDRAATIKSLLRYLDTDAVLIHTPGSDRFINMQEQEWTPIREWAQRFFRTPISRLDADAGLISHRQSDEARTAAQQYLETLDKWQLAAFERSVYATKSFLLAALLVESQGSTSQGYLTLPLMSSDNLTESCVVSVETIARLATLEVRYQTDLWGEVEDTHDVDHVDIRRQLASAVLLLA